MCLIWRTRSNSGKGLWFCLLLQCTPETGRTAEHHTGVNQMTQTTNTALLFTFKQPVGVTFFSCIRLEKRQNILSDIFNNSR